jgi:hypothetical protein
MRSALNKLMLYQQVNGFMTFREAVFNSEGDLELLGDAPAFPRALSLEDMKAELEEFIAALDRPVLYEEDISFIQNYDLEDFDVEGEVEQ